MEILQTDICRETKNSPQVILRSLVIDVSVLAYYKVFVLTLVFDCLYSVCTNIPYSQKLIGSYNIPDFRIIECTTLAENCCERQTDEANVILHTFKASSQNLYLPLYDISRYQLFPKTALKVWVFFKTTSNYFSVFS